MNQNREDKRTGGRLDLEHLPRGLCFGWWCEQRSAHAAALGSRLTGSDSIRATLYDD